MKFDKSLRFPLAETASPSMLGVTGWHPGPSPAYNMGIMEEIPKIRIDIKTNTVNTRLSSHIPDGEIVKG
jgi:hypothetical protein